ncbi:MAG: hypothetical protein QME76_04335 [Bacillota bacterium]|nr:hypothetical protein [Bacillota bacterium]
MRKLCIWALLLVFVLGAAAPAWAYPSSEVLTYGFTDERTREGLINGYVLYKTYKHWGGPSFSQPLLLDGNRWGGEFAGETLLVSVEGNTLYGFKLEAPQVLSWEVPDLQPLWSVWLDGTQPTKSDPTYGQPPLTKVRGLSWRGQGQLAD